MALVPFRLQYELTRRQRLAVELTPWLPCLAACLGFTVGVTYLSLVASRWFLPLLALPPIAYRGFFAFLFDIVVRPAKPIDVLVEEDRLGVIVEGERRWLSLAGVIQVYRSEQDAWTLLHFNGSILTIPGPAITPDQLDFLKGFALRAARKRASEQVGCP